MDVPKPIRARPRTRRIVLVGGLVAVAIGGTIALKVWIDRPPAIDAGGLWIGTVERGPLALEVRGQGRLVPEEVRWASAPISARVDKVLVQPGAEVQADDVIIELSNPDAELAVLQAEREVASAEAELARLGAALDTARLAQESTISSLDADRSIASRRADIDAEMAKNGVTSDLESAESADRAEQLAGRLAFEKKRLGAMRRSDSAQLDAQRGEVERLRDLAAFRRRQLDALHVRAGAAGVVQAVTVEVGQTVAAGAPVAKVVDPAHLKAELRVPETSAEDLAIGLTAIVDTRSGTVNGTVSRVDPAAHDGSVTVDVIFTDPLPRAARPDLTVDGTISLAHTGDVLHVARPAIGEAHATAAIFKLTPGGEAVRVPVTFGRTSVQEIEVTAGLSEGDRVILSDMSRWDGTDRLRVQ
jgi:RND family efflux transporter MFP subunit